MITRDTPLVHVVRPDNAEDVVRCFVANALSLVGLSTANETLERYLEVVGPGISARDVRDRRWSGCGVVAEGVHRRMLVDAPVLWLPYFPAALIDPRLFAITRAIAYLRGMGAWHWSATQADTEPRPGPGCYVVIGARSPREAYGGTEHALTAVRWEDDDVLVSVDGGQRDSAGNESVELRRRRWELREGRVRLVDVDTGRWRLVLGWGWPELMAYQEGLVTVPEGWEEAA